MPPITMNHAFIGRWTRMPHSIGRLSASASSHHSLSSAAFIINTAESDFRYTQGVPPWPTQKCARENDGRVGVAWPIHPDMIFCIVHDRCARLNLTLKTSPRPQIKGL